MKTKYRPKFYALLFVMALGLLAPLGALAMENAAGAGASLVGEPFTWAQLSTVAGASAFTLLFVQFVKAPLDRVWKIPTRLLAYFVALCALLAAMAFTESLSWEGVLLAAVNALVAAFAAYGAYEVTFAQME